MNKIKNKKTIIILALVIVIGAIGTTLAYFYSSRTISNSITTAEYSTVVVEEFVSPDNWLPGDTTEKKVNITNDGEVDIAVRAKVEEQWIAADGTTILSGERDGIKLALYDVGPYWVEEDDGYYYYYEILKPGETSFNFMNSVTFNPNFSIEEGLDYECIEVNDNGTIKQTCSNLSTGYAGAQFKLIVTIEAIQVQQAWEYEDDNNLLYRAIALQAVPDNVKSQYVSSTTGINFSKISSTTNGQGVYTVSSTINDFYPVHYFRGNVSNNNVLFANYCWKIVRTSETGGIKLIYNGKPTSDGKCTNKTGASTQIGTSPYSDTHAGLYGLSYMYNATDQISKYQIPLRLDVTQDLTMSGSHATASYYYGDGVTYNSSTKKYTLTNAKQYKWSSSYSSLNGTYRCETGSQTSCTTVFYIFNARNDTVDRLTLTKGQTFDDANTLIKVSKTIIDNGDGTYTLQDPISIKKLDWSENYSSYMGYYVCPDYGKTICNKKLYISNVEDDCIYGSDVNGGFLYGSSYTWDGSKYTLKNTISFWNLTADYSKLTKNHYTCLNNTGICSELYYVFAAPSTDNRNSLLVFKLTAGKDISDILYDNIWDSKVNKKDSVIKTTVDNWYQDNLIDYTGYLEDAIWCNERELGNYGTLSPTGGIDSSFYLAAKVRLNDKKTPTLKCLSIRDSFTVDKATGNGKLTYPIGLITADEVSYAGTGYITSDKSFYLYTGNEYFTMTPRGFSTSERGVMMMIVNSSGTIVNSSPTLEKGIRPMISLKHSTKYESGDGTSETPYIIATE